MKIFGFLFGVSLARDLVQIPKAMANQFLPSRVKRKNSWGEELWSGNLERECIEESCDEHELLEGNF